VSRQHRRPVAPMRRSLKFGGTSVADAEALQARSGADPQRQRSTRPIVVVSALAGVTDALLAAADAAANGGCGAYAAAPRCPARAPRRDRGTAGPSGWSQGVQTVLGRASGEIVDLLKRGRRRPDAGRRWATRSPRYGERAFGGAADGCAPRRDVRTGQPFPRSRRGARAGHRGAAAYAPHRRSPPRRRPASNASVTPASARYDDDRAGVLRWGAADSAPHKRCKASASATDVRQTWRTVGIGATGRRCCRLTHGLTSGEPASASGKRRAALYR